MNKLTISQAINLSGISRATFYKKYINTGRISVEVDDDKKYIDTSELIRVFKDLKLNTSIYEENKQQNTMVNNDLNKLVESLENQLLEYKTREKESQQREQWLQKQIDELREQQSRLLENPIKKRKKIFGLF